MTTRTRIARIAAAVLLAAPAYAQQPQGITKDPMPPLKQGAGPIVLKMGNEQGSLQGFTATWAGGKVAQDQWAAPAAMPLPTKAEPATLEFLASTGAPRTLYNWVTAAFSGKSVPQAGEVIRAGGRIEQFSGAVVGEVDFPELAAGKQKSEAEFVVRAKGQWLTGPAVKEAKAPVPPLAKMPPAVSGYRLSLGPVQAASIEGLDPLTLRPLQPAKITLHTRPPTTEALQKLATQPKAKQPVGAAKAPGPEGRLELLGADGRTVFATITLHDVQVEAASPLKPGVLSAVKAAPGLVTLTAARADVAFFPLKMQ